MLHLQVLYKKKKTKKQIIYHEHHLKKKSYCISEHSLKYFADTLM